MKINIIVPGRFHVEQLSSILLKNSFDIKIYSSSPKRFFPSQLKKYVVFVPMPFQIIRKIFKIQMPAPLRNLDFLIFDFLVSLIMRKPDVVYGFASTSLISGKKFNDSYFILDRACPHITFQNKILSNERSKLGIKRVRYNRANEERCFQEYKAADSIFVPSKYTNNSFQAYKDLKNKTYITHLGSNSDFNVSTSMPKKFTIGFIGENPLRKGLIYLLRASQDPQFNDCEFILRTNLAEFRNHNETQELIQHKNIRILDYIQDLSSFYQLCSVICLPSIDEGWGMVTLEALSSGVPVIASKNVGSACLLKDDYNGFIINPYSHEEIIHSLSKLKKNLELLKMMRNNARISYEKHISSNESYEKKVLSFFLNLKKGSNF